MVKDFYIFLYHYIIIVRLNFTILFFFVVPELLNLKKEKKFFLIYRKASEKIKNKKSLVKMEYLKR